MNQIEPPDTRSRGQGIGQAVPPQVTVVVPTYRRPDLLCRALQSVLDQTYPHFVVCVHDNASQDTTAEVVQGFAQRDPRFRYHPNSVNIGGIRNTAAGIAQVQTPYFCYLADDDLLLPNFLETAVTALEKHPEAGFFGGMCLCIDGAGVPFLFSGTQETDGCYPPPKGLLRLWEKGWPQQAGVLYRTTARDVVGDIAPIAGFDLEYMARIASRFGVVFSATPVAFFYINQQSASTSRTVRSLLEEWGYIRDAIAAYPWLDTESKQAVFKLWQGHLPYQIRMMTLHALRRANVEDAIFGLSRLDQFPNYPLIKPIMRFAITLAGTNKPLASLVARLFDARVWLFTQVRRARFAWQYRSRYPEYWRAMRKG
ncbi:MAG: glycosyltransferase family 2 protein [Magnetococcales bacterium]|nr:glycosyltransferase family 2 protein [Magnetococcales bacterium]